MLSVFPQLFFLEQIAPTLLRLILGVIFIIHGYSKLYGNFDGSVRYFESEGVKNAKTWVWVSGIFELIGGLLVFAGFLTQVAVLFLIVDRLASMIRIKLRKGFFSYEFDLVLIAIALALLFLGPGFFSIDLPY